MNRHIILCVVSIIAAIGVSVAANPTSRTRTLDGAVLNQAIGGWSEVGCCGMIDVCSLDMSCTDESPANCTNDRRHDERPNNNNQEGCEFDVDPEHLCTQGEGAPVICRKRWRCWAIMIGESEFCVKDNSIAPVDSYAPPSCSSNCT